MLEYQRLDTGVHDCAGFDCGVPALNAYLRKFRATIGDAAFPRPMCLRMTARRLRFSATTR